MIVVDGQKFYQGAYAERVQNRQPTYQMTQYLVFSQKWRKRFWIEI